MIKPTTAQTIDQLRIVISEHYDDTQRTSRVLYGGDLDALGANVTNRLLACQRRQLTTHEALAWAAVHVSSALHGLLCDSGVRACKRDVAAVCDFMATAANPYCGMDLDDNLSLRLDHILRSDGLDDTSLERAVAAVLEKALHPLWNTRAPLPIDANRANIQVNTAISQFCAPGTVERTEYDRQRSIGKAIENLVIAKGFRCELTSDYAAPGTDDFAPPDERLTIGAIYRSSGVITVTDNGRFGTAITLTIADILLVPTLALSGPQDQSKAFASRYPGEILLRDRRSYSDEANAVRVVDSWLDDNEGHIRRRAELLYKYSQLGNAHMQDYLSATDPAAFDESRLTYDLAKFYISDPVIWWQIPPGIARELQRVLGVRDPGRNNNAGRNNAGPARRDSVDARTLTSLHRAAETQQWTWTRIDALLQNYLVMSSRAVSTHQPPWEINDWILLDARLARGDES